MIDWLIIHKWKRKRFYVFALSFFVNFEVILNLAGTSKILIVLLTLHNVLIGIISKQRPSLILHVLHRASNNHLTCLHFRRRFEGVFVTKWLTTKKTFSFSALCYQGDFGNKDDYKIQQYSPRVYDFCLRKCKYNEG